ncbi:MAG: hypothetical protein E6J86_10170 [Deltaproteobacteria bacterium]|nr:MAG: hypothetical protein E6J86_10170 [Deltaproteobacteria bacterium]
MPGTYTIQLTKGSQVYQTKLDIGLDRRAPWNVADRRQQFDAAMKVHELFGEMSDVVERIDSAAAALAQRMKAQPQEGRLAGLATKLEAMKKKIVATKEGGAITGEERIREHTDHLYSALLSWEGKPARYLLERAEALGRELADVRAEFEAVQPQIQTLHLELQPVPSSVPRMAAACLLAREDCDVRREGAAR